MRVFFLDQYSDLGGAQQCLLDVLPAVLDAGWEAHVAIPGTGPLAERITSLGASLYSIPCRRLSSGPKSWSDVLAFIRDMPGLARAIAEISSRCKADLVYVNGPRVLPAASWVARKGPPLLFHSHNRLRQRADRWIAARALRLCNATLVGCCRFALEPLERHVPRGRSYLIHNGIDPATSANIRPAGNSGLTIGVIGRIAPDKGQKEFLEAARLLSAALPDSRFIICGDALFGDQKAIEYRDSLRALAEGLPVEFVGWRQDVAAVMSLLDILVVPSIWEPGAPRVILEACASSVPVVAFPAGGIPEILHDGETGFLVRPSTPQALAKKILSAVSQESTLAAVARAGHQLWKAKFTAERYRGEMLEIMARAAAQQVP